MIDPRSTTQEELKDHEIQGYSRCRLLGHRLVFWGKCDLKLSQSDRYDCHTCKTVWFIPRKKEEE